MLQLRGKFIVFDGNEGCGKSTQAKLLVAALEKSGIEVLAVRDPGATRIGEMVRAILLDPANTEMGMRCEMLLYMAARAQMMESAVNKLLHAPTTRLKASAADGGAGEFVEALKHLFDLPEHAAIAPPKLTADGEVAAKDEEDEDHVRH